MNVKPRRRKKRKGGGFSWSTYWATRYPSDLTLTVISATRIDLAWTNNGLADYTGVSIERGTDGINYVQIDTVIGLAAVYSDTTVVAGVLYYYRIRYYKDTSYSAPAAPEIVNAELTTYITGLATELSHSQIARIDTFISAIKTGFSISTLEDAFDAIWILAGETSESALKNLVKNSNHCTLHGNTLFTQYEGIAGDGIDGYINTNYTPSTHSVKHLLNDASWGLYSRTSRASSTTYYGNGAYDSNAKATLLYPLRAKKIYFSVNSLTVAEAANLSSQAFFGIHRVNDTEVKYSVNKTLSSAFALASTGLPTISLYLGARNNNGVPDLFDTLQNGFAYISKGLVQAEIDVLVDAVEAYMDSNGKGVI